jgi:DNA-binding response OmpR family regulator
MPALVLIAEDDDDLREAVAWSLRSEGYRVLETTDGDSAIWTMVLQKVDLLIIDLKLPKTDGATVVRLMRNDGNLRRIPVLVTTGYPELAPPDLALMAKPFSLRALVDVVNGMLAGKQRRATPVIGGGEPR